ncbi:ABC transporter substrate-binding protein [Paraburkholderia fungorum]|uniref:ABC transporter substrate-binding protein n=1 Tax=Paraburkholderia fungorum TaxID=134537 RepID=UPI001C1EC3D9|nr:ABC transporter substrate-binding protein [Paraburkholderia fungorum]MBU7436196.1 ABC transporter substrate-binding protein [Paraburkholderia fungorum]
MKARSFLFQFAFAALSVSTTGAVHAQTVKIGLVTSTSGAGALLGEHMVKAAKLYMSKHDGSLPPNVKVELIVRDDGGPSPDKAKQLAQELIVSERVNFLTGFVWSPNAAAVAPLSTEAKIPTVLMNAGASANITLSPYFTRFSFGTSTAPYYLGAWAGKRYKTVYIAVADYGPGFDSESAFESGFKKNGPGKIVGRVHMPVTTTDFVPYLQHVKDTRPDALFVFVPTGRIGANLVKSFKDLGLDQAGIKLIGTGDISADEELPSMGKAALGIITVHHYSDAGDRPATKAFNASWAKAYGNDSIPSFAAIQAWDAMDAIYKAIIVQGGKVDPDKTMKILRNYKSDSSPRGPISIDPQTRDIRQNEYVREVKMVDGKLANVEIGIAGKQVLDPWVEANRK